MNDSTRHKSCCFTGHRPEKLPWKENEQSVQARTLKLRLFDMVEAAYHAGITHFLCGMARGCDFYFCEAVLKLRSIHEDVTLEAAIPFEQQAERWPDTDRERYFRLIAQCDWTTVLGDSYDKDCMRRRNQYMVDHAVLLIAVYDGTPGGTMQTVNYAKSQGLEIVALPLVFD